MFGQVKAVEGGGEEEADEDVGDVDAGEDEDAEGGEGDEAGVEAGTRGRKGATGEGLEEEGEGEDGEGEGDAAGGGGLVDVECAEEAHGGGHGPVVEGCFFEVADAVGVEGDPVVAEEHLASDLRVDRIGVVEEGRGDEGLLRWGV